MYISFWRGLDFGLKKYSSKKVKRGHENLDFGSGLIDKKIKSDHQSSKSQNSRNIDF